MACSNLQECDDLPASRLGQVSKRRHTAAKRSIPQHPKQSSGRGSIDFRLIEWGNAPAAFPVLAVARSALASVELGPGALCLPVAFERVPQRRRGQRGFLQETPCIRPGDCNGEKKTTERR